MRRREGGRSFQYRDVTIHRVINVSARPSAEEGRSDLLVTGYGRDNCRMYRRQLVLSGMPSEAVGEFERLLHTWLPFLEHPRWQEFVRLHWPQSRAARPAAPVLHTCRRCGGLGHYAKTCPRREPSENS